MTETVKIQTTQNVEIEYPVAGVGDRVLAVLVDTFILIGYGIGVGFLLKPLSGLIPIENGMIAASIILYLPVLVYHLLCEIFMNGQSFGKKVLKIKVVKLDGSQPGFGDYFLRWLLLLIDVGLLFGSIAIFAIIISGKGQRLGDLAAGTTVVKIKSPVTLDDTILTSVEEAYQPMFATVTRLKDEDIATVKQLVNSNLPDAKTANHLAFKAKIAIENKIGVKSDLMPMSFLETILKDYNYLTGKVQD